MRKRLDALRSRAGMTARAAAVAGAVFFGWSFFASQLFAGTGRIPAENGTGLLYALTHLHPAAYFILFLVVVLSVVNLFFQGYLSIVARPFSGIQLLLDRAQERPPAASQVKGPRVRESSAVCGAKLHKAPASGISKENLHDGVLSVRRAVKVDGADSALSTPTPVEGINHPLPDFAPKVQAQSGFPRTPQTKVQLEAPPHDFKFSSAVDLPSREEMERREREQLVVSGSVTGTDGNGIPSVLVFLTDQEGNRVGQSCRSTPETGEFKVLVNEPGKYTLTGYKRGFIMESSEPLVLPIESGKVEGYSFRMIPEGCAIHGRVVIEAPGVAPGDLEVRCLCAAKDFSRSSRTDSVAGFRISGVPVNSQCVLEVWDKDSNFLAASDAFETARKKELHLDVAVGAKDDLPIPDQRAQNEVEAAEAQSSLPQ